jgi:hypothetical protein
VGSIDHAESRSDARHQIESEKTKMAHRIFDVVTEYPEIEHVSGEMQDRTVQKHRG